jgi:DinB family protein
MAAPTAASWIAGVLTRDLKALKREIEAYPADADLWRVAPGIANCGGNLALHCAGNLQHFIGVVLGGTEYARNRDAEFNSKGVPRAELLAQADAAIAAVRLGLERVTAAQWDAPYPLPVAGVTLTTGDFMTHLAAHMGYHLGQIDYHRRLVTGDGKTVGAMPPAELTTARKA